MKLELEDFDLYINGSVINLPDGDSMLIRDLINYDPKQPDIYHTVQDGDTITFISWLYYRNVIKNAERYWKFIADTNEIINPLDLSEYVGKDLVIPNFNQIKLAE